MIVDELFTLVQIGHAVAVGLNLALLLTFFLLPTKMNTSKYFIPSTAAQNIVFSVCSMLTVQRPASWDFCWIFASSGVLSDSWAVGQSVLVLMFLVFLASVLTSTNSFFHMYLQICRHKYFSFFSSTQGLLVVILTNLLVAINFGGYIYFGIWPADELIIYLAPTVMEQIAVDLTHVPFVGFCLKLNFSALFKVSRLKEDILSPTLPSFGNYDDYMGKPKVNWLSLLLVLDSMLTLSLLGTAGIYWAREINKTLKKSSLSSQTKTMQRRMNNLLVIQTACPAVFLQTPAVAQYLMVFTGTRTNIVMVYCCDILWMLYPIFSPLITIGFLKEYRNFYLKKLRQFSEMKRLRSLCCDLFISQSTNDSH